MNIAEKLILNLIKHKVSNWFALERSLTSIKGVHKPCEHSPEKSWPNPDKIPVGEEVPFSLKNIALVGPNLSSCVKQGTRAIKSIADNPKQSRTSISENELKDFEKLAKMNGIGAIGYTKLQPHLIFKERAVLYDTAIVLTMEMDKKSVAKAPSVETFKMVMSTYNDLGIMTNMLTDKLRSMGFQTQASHPLGGLVVYPPLAVDAGLGWFGRHGLLITPQFGAAQRISAIFVNIDNLPITKVNKHSWIGEFCKSCGKCIRACPSKAIYEKPIEHKSGRKTHISREKCLPVFVKQQGCTVCVKECVFTKMNYYEVQDSFSKRIK
jgi:epoxyqueuosine reductase